MDGPPLQPERPEQPVGARARHQESLRAGWTATAVRPKTMSGGPAVDVKGSMRSILKLSVRRAARARMLTILPPTRLRGPAAERAATTSRRLRLLETA